uniref:Thyrotropin receptor n=1 Tax=Oncorhynchus mykiss TaxID=8022 RepID=A0A8K9USF1_ONCMY
MSEDIDSVIYLKMNLIIRMFILFIASPIDSTDNIDVCPTFCDCTKWDSTKTVSCFEIDVLPAFHPSTKELWLVETRLTSISQDAFANLINISHIYISDDESLRSLERHSFHKLPKAIHMGIFNTGLPSFPALGQIRSSQDDFILEIVDNLFIREIPANSFNGISENEITLMLNSNGLTDIQPYAFNGTRLEEVYLYRNVDLVRLDERTFSGVISGPTLLDVSESRVNSLPTMGLEAVQKLKAKNTWALKKLPPLRAFQHLQSAELTYPSHCCGLSKVKRRRGHVESVICNLTSSTRRQQSTRPSGTPSEAYEGQHPKHPHPTSSNPSPRDPQHHYPTRSSPSPRDPQHLHPTSSNLSPRDPQHLHPTSSNPSPRDPQHHHPTRSNLSPRDPQHHHRTRSSPSPRDPQHPHPTSSNLSPRDPQHHHPTRSSPSPRDPQHLHPTSSSPYDYQYYYDNYSCPPSGECFYIVFPTEGPDEGFDYTLCDDDREDQGVPCTPLPDAFNPCEDVMSLGFLRVSVWLVSLLAVLANLLFLLILLTSHYKLTITRFLLCNLAMADLFMGVYLLLIASVDLYTRSQYHHYAIDWQTGAGCQLAGVLTVFASELSVYTLTAITLQRWHAITFAMRPERKVRLRHIVVLMLAGWLLCLVLAVLPLAGVSSYQRVSICLPMDTDSTAAMVYVVTLLMLNVLAFVLVSVCYVHIYCMVHNPQHPSSRGDASMAKRMAVLIFTNFLCLAPISFYGLSAVLHHPLITVTDSKVLHITPLFIHLFILSSSSSSIHPLIIIHPSSHHHPFSLYHHPLIIIIYPFSHYHHHLIIHPHLHHQLDKSAHHHPHLFTHIFISLSLPGAAGDILPFELMCQPLSVRYPDTSLPRGRPDSAEPLGAVSTAGPALPRSAVRCGPPRWGKEAPRGPPSWSPHTPDPGAPQEAETVMTPRSRSSNWRVPTRCQAPGRITTTAERLDFVGSPVEWWFPYLSDRQNHVSGPN